MINDNQTIQEKSCGCIINENKKVLLVRLNNGDWGFPKGHVEEKETEEQTAIREVKEETNLDVQIDKDKRYTLKYFTNKGKLKEVVIFLAKEYKGEIKPQESEISEIKWVGYEEAIEIIKYKDTVELLKKIIRENNL